MGKMKRVHPSPYFHPRSCGHIEFQPWPDPPPTGIAWWIKRAGPPPCRYTWRYVLKPAKREKNL